MIAMPRMPNAQLSLNDDVWMWSRSEDKCFADVFSSDVAGLKELFDALQEAKIAVPDAISANCTGIASLSTFVETSVCFWAR